MLVRLIWLGVVVVLGWALVPWLRGPELLRVPGAWRRLARRHAGFRRALALRRHLARLALARGDEDGDARVRAADLLLEQLAVAAERTAPLREALDELPEPARAEVEGRLSEIDARVDEAVEILQALRDAAAQATVEELSGGLDGPVRQHEDQARRLRSLLELARELDRPSRGGP